jgi:hypothetical protein
MEVRYLTRLSILATGAIDSQAVLRFRNAGGGPDPALALNLDERLASAYAMCTHCSSMYAAEDA